MKKKKRNDFIIQFHREKIIWNGLNDLYAEPANVMLFFLNEDKCAQQVRERNQRDLAKLGK